MVSQRFFFDLDRMYKICPTVRNSVQRKLDRASNNSSKAETGDDQTGCRISFPRARIVGGGTRNLVG